MSINISKEYNASTFRVKEQARNQNEAGSKQSKVVPLKYRLIFTGLHSIVPTMAEIFKCYSFFKSLTIIYCDTDKESYQMQRTGTYACTI
jgi:hypothetical protein